ncbi:heterokaryon incompatibility protein-domain-containing protein [Hypoxylon argillaceum]|nr:heterokaryon incompatibility protein-domain-containing protein [Hypoxylon argillaceum]
MRLLNAHTREIHNFPSLDGINEFAILSHTWGLEEVTLQDWQSLSTAELALKEGYRKIDYCCKQAIQDGYEWMWIDTCCIDKSSSAELSETINSMFQWYQDAAICYAHLTDVPDDTSQDSLLASLSASRWFTRGWTLQELLASSNIVFYTDNWQTLTTKLASVEILSTITGIDREYLEGAPLEAASAAKRMSWAASRETTRIEDMAYCLLGIFDVNMPLIYGEGKKAFKRLQEEIIKANPEDHTLFAWGNVAEKITDIPYVLADKKKATELEEIPWDASKIAQPLSGLLAESPADFKDSGGFIISNIATKFYKHAPQGVITSLPQIQDKNIRLQLPIHYNRYQVECYWKQPQIATLRNVAVAILLCCHEKSPNFLPGLLLRSCGGRSSFNRTREICVRYNLLPVSIKPAIFNSREMLNIGPPRQVRVAPGDVMLRRYVWGDKDTVGMGWRSTLASQAIPEGVVNMCGVKDGPICFLFNRNCQVSCRHGFALKLERIERDGESMAGISVSIIPLDIGPPEKAKFEPIKPDFGLKWNPRSQCIRAEVLPELGKVLKMPSDTVNFDILPFPVITIKAERILMNAKGSAADAFVDVLDIVVTERMLPYYPRDKQGIHEKNH